MRPGRWALVTASLLTASCAAPEPEAAGNGLLAVREAFAALDSPHVAVIASDSEPGERLLLLGRLVDRETGEPIAGHPVQMFHTDATGSYREAVAGDETTARLQGSVITDEEGRFLVSSIVPAGYDGGGGGHIHNLVEGATPEYYNFYFGRSPGRRLMFWRQESDQHILLDPRRKADTLLAVAILQVRGLAPGSTP